MWLNNKKLLILIIIIIAAFLRFWQLGSYPVSFSWDEAAIGYNAYSIAVSGADEYGSKWPLFFRSFNDFKLPAYVYIDAIFVKIFGLNEFAVRFPSALFGTLTVLLIYLLTKELFSARGPVTTFPPVSAQPSQTSKSSKLSQSVGLRAVGSPSSRATPRLSNWKLEIAHLSALMLAISPWHLQFSRGAFEANLSLFFVVLGILFIVYGLKNKLAAIFACPILALSIYSYYSPRIFVPIFIAIFFVIFGKIAVKNLKFYLAGFMIGILMLLPIASQMFSTSALKRVREVSIFADKSLIVDYTQAKSQNNGLLSAVFLNRRIPLAFETLHSYFSHFSPGFLFFGDDPNPRHRSAFHGNFYIFEIPQILIGLWIIGKLANPQLKYFLFTWLFTAPIAAGLTRETPHGLRSILMVIPLVIFSAIGAFYFLKKKVTAVILLIISLFFFINYLYSYYQVYPIRDSQSWGWGYKQMFSQVSKIENSFDRIIVTGYYWKPYIFYLFYNKIDPIYYQSLANQNHVGKYVFGTAGWDTDGKDFTQDDIESQKLGKTLVVLSPGELNEIEPGKFIKIATIYDFAKKQTIFEIGEWR